MLERRPQRAAVLASPAVAAALSRTPGESAAGECVDQVLAGLGAEHAGPGRPGVDLAVVFVAPGHVAMAGAIGRAVQKGLNARVLIGVSGGGVIGGAVESEVGPGVALLAASLPGVRVTPFCTADLPLVFGVGGTDPSDDDDATQIGDDGVSVSDVEHLAQISGMNAEHRGTLLFADPFSTPVEDVLLGFAAAEAARVPAASDPGAGRVPTLRMLAPLIGGLASASNRPRGNALLLNDRVFHSGLVGVSLAGPIRVDALVSQGCRGFGPNLVVTKSDGQIVEQVGGRPVLDVLHEAIEQMGPVDRQLLSRGLFVGRVVNEYKERFGRDDFLIRNVAGVLKDQRALAVADETRVGQTIRFHVRDAQTATEDLAMLLDAQSLRERPLGAVLVSCNGRGTRLFPEPHHDAAMLARLFDPRDSEPGEQKAKSGKALERAAPTPPIAGFFAAGEFGPVGDGVFLHGQTASAAIFRRA